MRARMGAWAGGEGACGVCAAVCVRVCVCGGGGGGRRCGRCRSVGVLGRGMGGVMVAAARREGLIDQDSQFVI